MNLSPIEEESSSSGEDILSTSSSSIMTEDGWINPFDDLPLLSSITEEPIKLETTTTGMNNLNTTGTGSVSTLSQSPNIPISTNPSTKRRFNSQENQLPDSVNENIVNKRQNMSITTKNGFWVWTLVSLILWIGIGLLFNLRTSFPLNAKGNDCNLSNQEIHYRLNRFISQLNEKVFGQHLAVDGVINSIYYHITDPNPVKALAISFNGMTGTGKTLLAEILANTLFDGGLMSPFVKAYFGPYNFLMDPILTNQNKKHLYSTITKMTKTCSRGLFIVEGSDKIPVEVLDTLSTFIGNPGIIDGIDYRRGIYIFISHTGSNRVNNKTMELVQTGKSRNELKLQDFNGLYSDEDPVLYDEEKKTEQKSSSSFGKYMSTIWNFLYDRVTIGYTCSCPNFTESLLEVPRGLDKSLIAKHSLINHYFPFLPLQEPQVIRCIQNEIKRRKIRRETVDLNKVNELVQYFPSQNKTFASEGCSNIASHLNEYYVRDDQINIHSPHIN